MYVCVFCDVVCVVVVVFVGKILVCYVGVLFFNDIVIKNFYVCGFFWSVL